MWSKYWTGLWSWMWILHWLNWNVSTQIASKIETMWFLWNTGVYSSWLCFHKTQQRYSNVCSQVQSEVSKWRLVKVKLKYNWSYSTSTIRAFKKLSRPKKFVKSNKSISRQQFFFQFLPWKLSKILIFLENIQLKTFSQFENWF